MLSLLIPLVFAKVASELKLEQELTKKIIDALVKECNKIENANKEDNKEEK